MFDFLSFQKKLVLCDIESSTMIAKVNSSKKGQKNVQIMCSENKESTDDFNVAPLMKKIGKKKAKLALILPLKEFQLVTVSVPAVSPEATSKLLPYTLSKVLDKPITDYIYDWHIAQEHKEKNELTVFLYSSEVYKKLTKELQRNQKEVAWFEPDVFAGCSFLANFDQLPKESSALLILIWKGSVSMAIFDEERIFLVRSFDTLLPEFNELLFQQVDEESSDGFLGVEPVDGQQADQQSEITESIDLFFSTEQEESSGQIEGSNQQEKIDSFFSNSSGSDDILSGFGLSVQDTPVEVPTPVLKKEEPIDKSSNQSETWQKYGENLNLEILRTQDYHSSVLKGKPVQTIYIGGAEEYFEAISEVLKKTHSCEIHQFPPEKIEAECSQTVAALCVGALER